MPISTAYSTLIQDFQTVTFQSGYPPPESCIGIPTTWLQSTQTVDPDPASRTTTVWTTSYVTLWTSTTTMFSFTATETRHFWSPETSYETTISDTAPVTHIKVSRRATGTYTRYGGDCTTSYCSLPT